MNKVNQVVAVIECAERDLAQMCELWVDEKKGKPYLEFFVDEKLEYIFFRTLKAMQYLHSSNVYYGDMKPENILIFKNYQVKLGDFGTALKLHD